MILICEPSALLHTTVAHWEMTDFAKVSKENLERLSGNKVEGDREKA